MSGSHFESWEQEEEQEEESASAPRRPQLGAQFTITFRRMGQYMLAAGDLLGRSQGVKLP